MAFELARALAPDARLLGVAVIADLAIGDPVYRWHPVRLIGRSLAATEGALRRMGADGYAGGIVLFVLLATVWVGGVSMAVSGLALMSAWLGRALHLFVLYSLLALGDLLRHVWRIERAIQGGDMDAARHAVSQLVGRDTLPMDAAACRRAAARRA